MKILIIGSKGFIGSACYAYFGAQPGVEAYGADVVAEYNDANYILIDAVNADFKKIFKDQQFDWCINCAGAASVPDSFKNPERDYLLNVQHLVHVLNAIKEGSPGCKLIQLSSAAVYGNPKSLPIQEHHSLEPLSPYGIHKKQAEELCKLYHDYFGVSVYVLRIFSAYGAGLKKQLFWDLYKKSLLQNSVTLFGTGNETRVFIHVNDILLAFDAVIKTKNGGFEIINVGNDTSTSIKDAARLFFKYLDANVDFNFNCHNRDGDPLFWEADNTPLQNLGYKQTVTFEQGIQDYCKWLKEKQ